MADRTSNTHSAALTQWYFSDMREALITQFPEQLRHKVCQSKITPLVIGI